MKTILPLILLLGMAVLTAANAQGTAFNYQGKLSLNGSPVNGTVDLQFTLLSSDVGGVPVAGPIVLNDRSTVDGLISESVDFGVNAFTGGARWLEIAVRPGESDGAFTALAPLQHIVASPYAVFAGGARGDGITSPLLMPWSSAGIVAYGFKGDSNTGIFSEGQNHLGLATQGVERIRIDPNGRVGVNTTLNNTYSLMVADANHQIALRDTNSGKVWTLTTVSNAGFGIYDDGTTQRLAIDVDGTVTVEGGKAVVYNYSSTETMIRRMTATLTASMGPSIGVDGTLTWGNVGFTAPPEVYVGSFTPGAAGMGDFDHFTVTAHSATTTGCKIRIFNSSTTSASITGGVWSVLIVGSR